MAAVRLDPQADMADGGADTQSRDQQGKGAEDEIQGEHDLTPPSRTPSGRRADTPALRKSYPMHLLADA